MTGLKWYITIPLFYKSLKYSKTGFLSFIGPEKYFLFVRHKNSYVLCFANVVNMPHLLSHQLFIILALSLLHYVLGFVEIFSYAEICENVKVLD
jgi:hypothetical protein